MTGPYSFSVGTNTKNTLSSYPRNIIGVTKYVLDLEGPDTGARMVPNPGHKRAVKVLHF